MALPAASKRRPWMSQTRAVLGAFPHHHEVPTAPDRDGGQALETRGVGVDPELAAPRRPGRREPLAEYPVVVSVLAVLVPDDDEVAVRLHRRRGRVLAVGGVGVDPELAAGGDLRRGGDAENHAHDRGCDGRLHHPGSPAGHEPDNINPNVPTMKTAIC